MREQAAQCPHFTLTLLDINHSTAKLQSNVNNSHTQIASNCPFYFTSPPKQNAIKTLYWQHQRRHPTQPLESGHGGMGHTSATTP